MLLMLLGLAQADEIVIDDQDGPPHFTTTGDDWTTWGMSGYGFDGDDSSYHYTSHTVGGSDRRGTATWTPDITTEGTWEVQVWFRRTENRTPDADFVLIDGHGKEQHISVDQRGDGASGWLSLGEQWCAEGRGGCIVTLDANDDDHSDEANAVRFVLLDEEKPEDDPPENEPDPELIDCDEFPGLGSHVMTLFAEEVGAAGWGDAGHAQGEPDGLEAWSENVDADESLRASGFAVCNPKGEESIDRVVVSTKASTQYDSGPYELRLRLDAGGESATVFNGVQTRWHEVDISADRSWTWEDLAALQAAISLHDHPQGNRDSDAWVDAFRLSVHFTTTEAPTQQEDVEDSASWFDSDPSVQHDERAPPSSDPAGCGCSSTGSGGLQVLIGLLIAAGLRRREAP